MMGKRCGKRNCNVGTVIVLLFVPWNLGVCEGGRPDLKVQLCWPPALQHLTNYINTLSLHFLIISRHTYTNPSIF